MKITQHLVLLLFCVQFAYGQTHIYQHFGVDEGLPSSEAYDIYQDKEGYMWFTTDKGLSRFNGYEFENYTTKDGLPDNTILDFYPQDNGQVWCYSYHTQNLFYFDEVFDGFKPYAFNTALKEALNPKSIVKSVHIDQDGTMYIGGYLVEGLIKITKNGILSKQYESNTHDRSRVRLGIMTNIDHFFMTYHDYKPDENILFFNTKQALTSRADVTFLNDKQFIFIDRKLGSISSDGSISYYKTEQNPTGIKRINDEQFFVGYYSNGAEIRDVDGSVLDQFLPGKSVSSFFIDKEGSYWFSTIDDGVFYIKNPKIQMYADAHISTLVKDNGDTLYAGLHDGTIVKIRNQRTDTLYKGLNDHPALVEFDAKNANVYGYADNTLYNYTTKRKVFRIRASKLPEHIGNNLVSSVSTSFISKIKDSLHVQVLDYKIQDICNDATGVLIGTSAGLFIQKSDSISANQPMEILKSRIDDIDFQNATNMVYMASQGAGVIVYGDSIYNIDKDDGLTNNIVNEVHIENDSTLWACTSTGLNRISFKKNHTFDVVNITKENGLLSNDIEDVEIINDTVWVATKRGLCFFRKDVITEMKSSKILSLSLKNVSVNNRSVGRDTVQLDYNNNAIEFTLQAISLRNTRSINYKYRLKEIDTTWTTTTNRKIAFPSLSPGNYTFQAKATLANKQDEYLINYSFKVQPPFWQRWWFYTICVLSFLGLVYLFFRIRVLTYNQDVFRELTRLAIKRLKRKEQFYTFRSNGEDFKIPTREIQYVNSQGNYLDIVTQKKIYTIRCKIGNFISDTPDALEYLRIHRSYIVRIDQISSKGKNWVVIKDNKIPVGETYLGELEKIQF